MDQQAMDATPCRCPRCHAPRIEDVPQGERAGLRTEAGELLRPCLACVVQLLHDRCQRKESA